MKKITFAVAALAVVLFAGCNKEESYTLKIGAEVPQNTTKQVWNSELNQVMFENGDQILLNGQRYDVTPYHVNDVNGVYTDSVYSYYATIEIGGECLNYGPAVAYYPASAFDQNMRAGWMNDNARGVVLNGTYELIDETQQWPMVGYVPQLTENSTFMLYNTTALFAPAVKYGRNFLVSMYNEGFLTEAPSNDFTTFPELTIQYMRVDGDFPMAGYGTIINPETAMPGVAHDCRLVLDEDIANFVVIDCANYADPINVSDGRSIDILGNVAVPATTAGHRLTITVGFTLDGVEYVYHSAEKVLTEPLVRNQRTTLIANFYDGFEHGTVTLAPAK